MTFNGIHITTPISITIYSTPRLYTKNINIWKVLNTNLTKWKLVFMVAYFIKNNQLEISLLIFLLRVFVDERECYIYCNFWIAHVYSIFVKQGTWTMIHIVDIWSYSISEWPILTWDDFRITISLNTKVCFYFASCKMICCIAKQ